MIKKVIGLLTLALLIYLINILNSENILSVTNEEEVILSLPYEDGDEFELSYEMSLYKVDQSEHFMIRDDKIYLKEVEFGSYDAYDYYEASSDHTLTHLGNDHYLLEDINLFMDAIIFRNAHFSNHELLVNDHVYNLGKLAEKGEKLEIKIEKSTLINRIQRRLDHE